MVSVSIILIITAITISVLNPIRQFSKAKDSIRVSDIAKISSADELYYDNNKNCYQNQNSPFPFGQRWSDAKGIVYMSRVPQDPDNKNDSTQSYLYETDGTSCPQWNVLFARLSDSSNKSTVTCPLEQLKDQDGNSCLPPGFDHSGYNYCVVSGNVDCGYIATNSLSGLPTNVPTPTLPPGSGGSPGPSFTPNPSASGNPGPTATPSPTATPGGGTPTPTPTPTAAPTATPVGCSLDYDCLPQGLPNGQVQITCQNVATGHGQYCERSCGGQC